MNVDEYVNHDALGLAELVRNGEVTAEELSQTARKAATAVNDRLNAVVGFVEDTHAEHPDPAGRFVGVPTFLKDLGAGIAGMPQDMGSRLTAGFVVAQTSYLTHKMLQAGFNVIGRTTCPEFGLTLTTESVLYGATCNPWNTQHITGGSSGGSAALVAAGVVPLAHTNDGGGSTRIPASICGNVGLKTSRGRVSLAPSNNDVSGALIVEGCNSRTVRDTAAFLDATLGTAPGEATILPEPETTFLAGLDASPRQYRIAISLDDWGGGPMHPDIAAEVERIGQVLTDLGHTVDLATPAIVRGGEAHAFFKSLWFALAELTVASVAPLTNRTPGPDTLEPTTLEMVEAGGGISALQFNQALTFGNTLGRALGHFFGDWDLLLTPTLNQPTPALGSAVTLTSGAALDDWYAAAMACVPHTPIANLTGLPAISVPCGIGPNAMPLGMHFFAPMGGEAELLDVAAQLEKAEPWLGRRPGVHAGRR